MHCIPTSSSPSLTTTRGEGSGRWLPHNLVLDQDAIDRLYSFHHYSHISLGEFTAYIRALPCDDIQDLLGPWLDSLPGTESRGAKAFSAFLDRKDLDLAWDHVSHEVGFLRREELMHRVQNDPAVDFLRFLSHLGVSCRSSLGHKAVRLLRVRGAEIPPPAVSPIARSNSGSEQITDHEDDNDTAFVAPFSSFLSTSSAPLSSSKTVLLGEKQKRSKQERRLSAKQRSRKNERDYQRKRRSKEKQANRLVKQIARLRQCEDIVRGQKGFAAALSDQYQPPSEDTHDHDVLNDEDLLTIGKRGSGIHSLITSDGAWYDTTINSERSAPSSAVRSVSTKNVEKRKALEANDQRESGHRPGLEEDHDRRPKKKVRRSSQGRARRAIAGTPRTSTPQRFPSPDVGEKLYSPMSAHAALTDTVQRLPSPELGENLYSPVSARVANARRAILKSRRPLPVNINSGDEGYSDCEVPDSHQGATQPVSESEQLQKVILHRLSTDDSQSPSPHISQTSTPKSNNEKMDANTRDFEIHSQQSSPRSVPSELVKTRMTSQPLAPHYNGFRKLENMISSERTSESIESLTVDPELASSQKSPFVLAGKDPSELSSKEETTLLPPSAKQKRNELKMKYQRVVEPVKHGKRRSRLNPDVSGLGNGTTESKKTNIDLPLTVDSPDDSVLGIEEDVVSEQEKTKTIHQLNPPKMPSSHSSPPPGFSVNDGTPSSFQAHSRPQNLQYDYASASSGQQASPVFLSTDLSPGAQDRSPVLPESDITPKTGSGITREDDVREPTIPSSVTSTKKLRSSRARKTGSKSTALTSQHFPEVLPPVKSPRPPAGTVSCIAVPALGDSTFGLIQEEFAHEPFKLLIAVILLNKTKGSAAIPILRDLIKTYPNPHSLAYADVTTISNMIKTLGLQHQRAKTLVNLAVTWVRDPPTKGKRHRTLHYPFLHDGEDIKSGEIIADDDARSGALEIGHLPGLGPYAYDSWRIFCRDEMRGVATDWKGRGSRPGFEPEWKRVLPQDKELRAILKWMWLKDGWVWDPTNNGQKHHASAALMRQAAQGSLEWESESGVSLPIVPLSEQNDLLSTAPGSQVAEISYGYPSELSSEMSSQKPTSDARGRSKVRRSSFSQQLSKQLKEQKLSEPPLVMKESTVNVSNIESPDNLIDGRKGIAQTDDAEGPADTTASRKKVRYHCTKENCTRSFSKKNRLANHLKTDHAADVPITGTLGAGSSSAEAADLPENTSLRTEPETITKRQNYEHHCGKEDCSESFKEESDLMRHLATVHATDNKKFWCDVCQISLSGPRELNRHYRTQKHEAAVQGTTQVQATETKFKCDVCQVSLSRQDKLERHYQSLKHKSAVIQASGGTLELTSDSK